MGGGWGGGGLAAVAPTQELCFHSKTVLLVYLKFVLRFSKKIVSFVFIQKQSYLFLRVIGLLLVWCFGGWEEEGEPCEKGSVRDKVSNK